MGKQNKGFGNIVIMAIVCVLVVVGCSESDLKTYDLSNYEVESCAFQVHGLDSVLLFPQGIHAYKDYLIVLEPKRKESLISVFSQDSLMHLFSCLQLGRAKNEMLSLYNDFFAYTDSSFFLLAHNNIVKELRINGDTVSFIGEDKIETFDALNHVLRIGNKRYVTAGLTNGSGNEHFLYASGKSIGFGEYPEPKPEGISNFYLNISMSAGMEGKNRIWDFSKGRDLVRSYDLDGNLIETIKIINNERLPTSNKNEEDYSLCYYNIAWNKSYIAVLYNVVLPRKDYYDKELGSCPWELQLWTWDGKLERRLKFDHAFNMYTISDDNVLYAMWSVNPNVLYTYDLKK